MPQLSIRGADLYYEQAGTGVPVLFIHGMCGDAAVWADQVRRWSPEFRCVTYDRRGHTRSSLGETRQVTVETHADDAAALMAHLGIDVFAIVGSSGGARVGLDVARRYPEHVRCAVLSEPPLTGLEGAAGEAFVAAIRPDVAAAMSAGGPRAAVDAFFAAVCPGLWGRLDDAGKEPYRANHAELLRDLGMPPYVVSLDDLRRIRVSCLIVSGARSAPFLRGVARALADHIPNARWCELPACGHVTYAEDPAGFAAAAMAFVRDQPVT